MAKPKQERTKIFISYSHKDAKWLERLKVHLRPLIRDQELDVWDDTMIAAGATWQEDIKRAITTTKVAILLISADFLASEFITTNELTPLLQAAKKDGAIIIPVIISPSGFQQNPIVSKFQAINDPKKPLINLKKGEQEAVWVKVIEAVKSSLKIFPRSGEVETNNPIAAYQINNSPSKNRPQFDGVEMSTALLNEQLDKNDIKFKIERNYETTRSSRLTKIYKGISIALIALMVVISGLYFSKNNKLSDELPLETGAATVPPDGELPLEADAATIYLDLTSNWVELNEVRRKTERVSKATLYGKFDLRKYNNNAQFTHRLGTSSVVPNPLDWRSDHRMEAKSTEKKCASEVKTTYMLHFDIKDKPINLPFALKYAIDFWNAHNGEKGDWHQFYVSSPTKELTFNISFPKFKPYTKLYFLSGEGGDCSHPPSQHKELIVHEWVDEKTGAKNISWKIKHPRTHWIYRVQWDW